MENRKFIKITKAQEWELLSKNRFKKIHKYIKEDAEREGLFNAIAVGFDFDKFYNESEESFILIKNGSSDYVDDTGCQYTKKGQAYMLESEKTITILKDYGFSLSFRVIEK